jgi:hypothetical protein
MNNARKIREIEKIYFYDTKELEKYSNELKSITKEYNNLKNLCNRLITSNNAEVQKETLINIQRHLNQ